MRTESNPAAPIAVDEHEAARALGISVHTLRKDRINARRIPFYKIGGTIRYDLTRVRDALAAYEQGGPTPRRERRAA